MKSVNFNILKNGKSFLAFGVAVLIGLSAPYNLSLTGDLISDKTAMAKGGGGNGGGNGNNGQSASAAADGHGHGHSQNGASKSAASLGALNAAHSSKTAQANAAPHSQVGKVANYHNLADDIAKAETDEGKQEAINKAGEALAAAANKSINRSVVQSVNDLLGVDMDEDTAQAVSDAANAVSGNSTDDAPRGG